MDEEVIYQQFRDYKVTVSEAIQFLERLGYEEGEAQRIVAEWQDALSEDEDGQSC